MNIDDLKQAGGFVPAELVKRPIKWEGHDGDVFVRRVSFATIAATQALPEAERNVALVRECIRFGGGDEQLTEEQAGALSPALATALLGAIADVNRFGVDAADPKP